MSKKSEKSRIVLGGILCLAMSMLPSCSKEKEASANMINGHEYVDLGLSSGTLWATCNVGAEKPEDYGDYFAWGETTGYDSGKTIFGQDNYDMIGCYIPGGVYATFAELDLSDDSARANWGGSWRMPSRAQIDELISECNTEWTTQGGVYGRKVTSKKNGNSIFLPAAGYRGGSVLQKEGSLGHYWSRSVSHLGSDYNYSSHMYLNSDTINRSLNYRFFGQSIRPVASE